MAQASLYLFRKTNKIEVDAFTPCCRQTAAIYCRFHKHLWPELFNTVELPENERPQQRSYYTDKATLLLHG